MQAQLRRGSDSLQAPHLSITESGLCLNSYKLCECGGIFLQFLLKKYSLAGLTKVNNHGVETHASINNDRHFLMSVMFWCHFYKYFEDCQLMLKFHKCSLSRKINTSCSVLDVNMVFCSYSWQPQLQKYSLFAMF